MRLGNDFFFVIALAFRQGVCEVEVKESREFKPELKL